MNAMTMIMIPCLSYKDCEGDTNSIKDEKRKTRITRLQDEAQYIDDLKNELFV